MSFSGNRTSRGGAAVVVPWRNDGIGRPMLRPAFIACL